MAAAEARSEQTLSRITFVLPLLAYLVLYFVDRSQFHPSGDGYYSWIFARSIAFDGDIDFQNDYAICGDPMQVGVDRGTGHLDNPFYAGPAAFWVPQLLVLRAAFSLALGAAAAARASCGGWMTALTILSGPLCGALTVWLSYRASRLVVPSNVAAFIALVFAFSSPLFPYATSVAHYSHVYLAFCVAALAYVALRIATMTARPLDGVWIALALALAVLNRLPALLYAVVPFAALFTRGLARSDRFRLALAISVGALVGIGLTASLYLFLYGKALAVPQGPNYVHLSHAHPLLVLFGVHGGFFFWMPAAWLAVPGALFAVRDPRLRFVAAACILATVLELVVSSASLDWSAHWTLGARRLLPLIAFVIVFSAICAARLYVVVEARLKAASWRALAVAVVVLTLVNNVPAATTIRGDVELTQRDLYGAMSPLRPFWALLDRASIDVALLPAEAYFAVRYGLPFTSYREVITPRYRRGHRDLLFFPHARIAVHEPAAAKLVAGAEWSNRGARIVPSTEGRIVFAAEWPFATHVRLLVSSAAGGRLHMAVGRAFGRRLPIGTVDVPAGSTAVWRTLELPSGSFDSGILEWTFTSEDDAVLIEDIEIEDRKPRTPYG